ncbi:hypothetical protein G7050_16785 [Dysgonomonas sp. HDW5A]|uniref:lantibiotic dehydratase family protein n=1 Tax=Dysgonomonas sp. HDW5A TaxID=2714926 RepID=UPI00140BF851|nr:lantibiotic dehydratase family protein [Dysgonomonas sp. HDW5A]QIK61409.1 hypothetical protein G7050_16785 [Dysgonomonas sp. HDW5A]
MIYENFNKLIIRAPSLSFNILDNISCVDDLMAFLENKLIKEAIYLASPELYQEVIKYLKHGIHQEKDKQRILNTIYKYISRMATRCTPFGLFSGCFIGYLSEKTNLIKDINITRRTRLDMFFLCELHQKLSKLTEIRSSVKYYLNSTLYSKGQQYRYIEYKYHEGQRKHIISTVEHNEYIEYILKLSTNGIYFHELLNYLTNECIEEESAITFINEMIDCQIIIDELSPIVTGGDYFQKLIELLIQANVNDAILSLLISIQSLLDKLDETFSEQIYENIIHQIEKLEIPFNKKYLFQVDFLHNMKKSDVSQSIITELKSTIRFLSNINGVIHNNNIKNFKEEFYRRYEDRMIPLLEVLDPDLGISYPVNNKKWESSPLIDDILFPAKSEKKKNTFSSPSYQDILLEKFIHCMSNDESEIILIDNDFNNKEIDNSDELPLTTAALFEVVRDDARGVLVRLKSCGGFSGASLFTRFAYLDPEIEELVINIANKEQELYNDKIIAEIVHLPDSRTGNILSRPHLRNYELIYMANSDLGNERLIPASDLMLCCRGDELVLFSNRLNKEIIPRLTNAHNYNNLHCTPVYRFLCDMQMHLIKDLSFNWGILESQLFLPRVRYKNTILYPMTWNIPQKNIHFLLDIKDDYMLVNETNCWRKKYKIPQYVLMPIGDNSLFIDFKNVLSIHSLLSEIKNKEIITFTEFIFDTKDAIIRDNNGIYTNECIATFYKKE